MKTDQELIDSMRAHAAKNKKIGHPVTLSADEALRMCDMFESLLKRIERLEIINDARDAATEHQ